MPIISHVLESSVKHLLAPPASGLTITLLSTSKFSDPPQRTRLRIKIINRHIEEPLYLTCVEIHRDDMITPRSLQHICHEFRRDGSAGFVLLSCRA
jgi:hypothetical protein